MTSAGQTQNEFQMDTNLNGFKNDMDIVCEVPSASHKRKNSIGFHLHERSPIRDREEKSGCQGLGGRNGEFLW